MLGPRAVGDAAVGARGAAGARSRSAAACTRGTSSLENPITTTRMAATSSAPPIVAALDHGRRRGRSRAAGAASVAAGWRSSAGEPAAALSTITRGDGDRPREPLAAWATGGGSGVTTCVASGSARRIVAVAITTGGGGGAAIAVVCVGPADDGPASDRATITDGVTTGSGRNGRVGGGNRLPAAGGVTLSRRARGPWILAFRAGFAGASGFVLAPGVAPASGAAPVLDPALARGLARPSGFAAGAASIVVGSPSTEGPGVVPTASGRGSLGRLDRGRTSTGRFPMMLAPRSVAGRTPAEIQWEATARRSQLSHVRRDVWNHGPARGSRLGAGPRGVQRRCAEIDQVPTLTPRCPARAPCRSGSPP